MINLEKSNYTISVKRATHENSHANWVENILPQIKKEDFTNEQKIDKIIKLTKGLVKHGNLFETQSSINSTYDEITLEYRIRIVADSLVHLLEMITTFENLFNPYGSDIKTTLYRLNWKKPHQNNIKNEDLAFGCIFSDAPKMNYFVRALAAKWDGFTNKRFENKFYWNDSEHRAEDIVYQIKLELQNEHLTHENTHIIFDEFNEYFKKTGRLIYKVN